MDSTTLVMVDPRDRTLPLKDLPLAIVIISSVFYILSAALVLVRCMSRLAGRVFGWDDGLMAAGTVRETEVRGTHECTAR